MPAKFVKDDVVDAPNRSDLKVYGIIQDVGADNTAHVQFKMPRRPKVASTCDECGWPGFLSVNGGTGEIVCMRSGCEHGHGFDVSVEILAQSELVNITARRRQEKTELYLGRLTALMREGVSEYGLTLERVNAIFQAIC